MKQLLLIISFFSIAVIASAQRSDSSEDRANPRQEKVSEESEEKEDSKKKKDPEQKEVSEQKEVNGADTAKQPEGKKRRREKPAEKPAPKELEKDTVRRQRKDSTTRQRQRVDTITPRQRSSSTPGKPTTTITIKKDKATDSLKAREARKAHQDTFLLTQRILKKHPFFNFKDEPSYPPYKKKAKTSGKENEFYTIAALLLLFATFKTVHEKYFSNLKDLFIRRSVKQRQMKQQLVQNSLPSFLFNLFFVLVSGFYVSLTMNYLSINPGFPFWELFGLSAAIIAALYLGKYLIIKLIGWIFKIKTLADNYLFLVFLINKVIAVVLLPLVIMIALGGKELSTVGWTLSWLAILSLFLYRYAAAIRLVSKDKHVALFYFLIYACAFEIFPIVMLYKGIPLFLK